MRTTDLSTPRWAFDLCRFSEPPAPAPPPAPPAPPPAPPATPPSPPGPPADPAPDALAAAQAEIEKWKALSQQNEARAKANADKAKQFDEIQAAGQTELEKATARAEAAEKAAADTLANSIASEVRAAADAFVDRSDAVNELTLQDGGLQRFVRDGQIDRDAINAALTDVIARKAHLKKGDAPPPPPPPQDPGLGPRGGGNTVDYRTVDETEFKGELAKYGLRPRST